MATAEAASAVEHIKGADSDKDQPDNSPRPRKDFN
jgi:hypothetical protein